MPEPSLEMCLPPALATAAAAEQEFLGERQAWQAAAIVALLVGVPAVVAVCAVLALFVLSSAVLLAPLVAVVLTWTAWRSNRRPL